MFGIFKKKSKEEIQKELQEQNKRLQLAKQKAKDEGERKKLMQELERKKKATNYLSTYAKGKDPQASKKRVEAIRGFATKVNEGRRKVFSALGKAGKTAPKKQNRMKNISSLVYGGGHIQSYSHTSKPKQKVNVNKEYEKQKRFIGWCLDNIICINVDCSNCNSIFNSYSNS